MKLQVTLHSAPSLVMLLHADVQFVINKSDNHCSAQRTDHENTQTRNIASIADMSRDACGSLYSHPRAVILQTNNERLYRQNFWAPGLPSMPKQKK